MDNFSLEKPNRKIQFFFAFCALALSLLFFHSTGLIGKWGEWYSQSQIYRYQTDAFLDGHLSLFEDPTRMTYDFVLYNGKIQQIWGLAVPMLRLPFEIIAKVTGSVFFPDRIVLFIYTAGFLFFLCNILYGLFKKIFRNEFSVLLGTVAVCFVITFMQPIFALARTRFIIYEEAIYYAYLFSFISLFWLLLVKSESRRGVYIFALSMGLLGFVRPTAWAYGISSVLALCLMLRNKRTIGLVLLCFILGFSAVFVTNYNRFGNLIEFGHALNADTDPLNNYQLKFTYPFKTETLAGATRELFGAVFLAPDFNNNKTLYKTEFFSGQSKILRWRNFYSDTFNIGHLALIIISGLLGMWVLIRKKHNHSNITILIQRVLVWSLVSSFCLSVFYLYSPSISSRYIVDFAPAMGGFILLIVLSLSYLFRKKGKAPLVMFFVLSVLFCGTLYGVRRQIEKKKPSARHITFQEAYTSWFPKIKPYKQINNEYSLAENLTKYGVYANGSGWNIRTGKTKSVVLLFLKDIEYVRMLIDHEKDNSIPYELEIKIGHVYILPTQIKKVDENSSEVTFLIPEKFKKGYWPVFLRILPIEKIQEETGEEFKLVKVWWNDN